MPRNMSFTLTIEPYKNQTKTVTRRNGWRFAQVGDVVTGCEKCQGLKRGETVVKMGQHVWISLRWEPLRRMTDDLEYGRQEVILEGFPHLTPAEFVEMYCEHNRCAPETLVHRMEFEYLGDPNANRTAVVRR